MTTRTSSQGAIGLLVLFGALLGLVGLPTILNSVTDDTAPTPTPSVSTNACLDADAPNTSDTVTYKDNQYDLIKKDAGISNAKLGEMRKDGSYNGADIYVLENPNYFGDQAFKDVIYVKRSADTSYTYFDIYLLHGKPIPDGMRNGQSIGGGRTITIIIDDPQFPPQGFNTSAIEYLIPITLNHPAYISTNKKLTFAYVNGLSGVAKIGKLTTIKGTLDVYYHLDTIYLVQNQDAYEYIGTDTPVTFDNVADTGIRSLHLKQVHFKTVDVTAICWYTPECKPAIYLYPEKKTSVQVKVIPKGYFTFTDPPYNKSDGWQVIAYPDGTIESQAKSYPYLYYESKLLTSEIKAPKEGYVVAYNDLPDLYKRLLPTLGLSPKELADFSSYWKDVLPVSSYYFVGIMNEEQINHLEPMSIVPQPAQTLRIRLYFEALKAPKSVQAPSLAPVQRSTTGFTVVEWGGIVKTNGNTSFTCSQ